jgi:hypothetical protein
MDERAGGMLTFGEEGASTHRCASAAPPGAGGVMWKTVLQCGEQHAISRA